jgi:hypothetical protein
MIKPSSTNENWLLDVIARRGQTERETNPTILLASMPPCTADHRRGAAPYFKWGSFVRLISWPVQHRVVQQGRLQRRSLFLALPRIPAVNR